MAEIEGAGRLERMGSAGVILFEAKGIVIIA